MGVCMGVCMMYGCMYGCMGVYGIFLSIPPLSPSPLTGDAGVVNEAFAMPCFCYIKPKPVMLQIFPEVRIQSSMSMETGTRHCIQLLCTYIVVDIHPYIHPYTMMHIHGYGRGLLPLYPCTSNASISLYLCCLYIPVPLLPLYPCTSNASISLYL